MSAFHYRLQRVLDAREAMMTRCEMRLAESERELDRCRREQEACDAAMRQQSAKHAATAEKEALSVREHIVHRAWIHHLSDCLTQSVRTAANTLDTVNKRRDELRKALVDHKIMQSLSNKERSAWVANANKKEQIMLDEQATSVFLRNRKPTPPSTHDNPQLEHHQ
ncbi:MAG TPA: hypothetical protein DCS43_08295 [Verrucomicrobia bacterium]|nr:hypothetical protein [Verrucomicrobiota bacterium]